MKHPMRRNPSIINHTIRVPGDILYFNEHKALHVHTRNLPHWRQDGTSYFLTFRQADSSPRSVWETMKREVQAWNERIEEHRQKHGELSASLSDDWEAFQRRQWIRAEQVADECQGSCLLADEAVRQLVVDAVMFFEGARQTMHALVVMPNHVHLLVTPKPEWSLDKLTQSWKGFTAREINAHLGRAGPLWQQESFDRIVRNAAHFERIVKYIANNPAKARLGKDRSSVDIAECCLGEPSNVLREESPEAAGNER